jgi:polysaccharide pyruvyl transferase WcaK-like protein
MGLPVYLTENDGRDSFLEEVAEITGAGIIPVYTSVFMAAAVLANASLFISGRYHPTIMASLGGTPCIFLSSVAHKMGSLQALLEYPEPREFSIYPSAFEIEQIYALADGYVRAGVMLRDKLRRAACRRAGEALSLCEHISVAAASRRVKTAALAALRKGKARCTSH